MTDDNKLAPPPSPTQGRPTDVEIEDAIRHHEQGIAPGNKIADMVRKLLAYVKRLESERDGYNAEQGRYRDQYERERERAEAVKKERDEYAAYLAGSRARVIVLNGKLDATEKRVAELSDQAAIADRALTAAITAKVRLAERIADLESQLAEAKRMELLDNARCSKAKRERDEALAQLAAAAAGEVFRVGDRVCFHSAENETDCGTVLEGPDPERTSFKDHIQVKFDDMSQPGLFEPRELRVVRRVVSGEESEK